MARPSQSPLDDSVGAALRTRHVELGRSRGRALAYQPEVATFCAVPGDPTDQDWVDLATLLGPGGFADLFSLAVTPPPDWQPVFTMTGVQLTAPDGQRTGIAREAEIIELGCPDVPEMMRLAQRTQPGPFWAELI